MAGLFVSNRYGNRDSGHKSDSNCTRIGTRIAIAIVPEMVTARATVTAIVIVDVTARATVIAIVTGTGRDASSVSSIANSKVIVIAIK